MTRLPGYDYSTPGYYFFTTVTRNREHLFGDIVNQKMVLNKYGKIVHDCCFAIPDHLPYAEIDEFIVMPNHVHGIIQIVSNCKHNNDNHGTAVEAQFHADPVETRFHVEPVETQHAASLPVEKTKIGKLSVVIRSFKSAVTRNVNLMNNSTGQKIWQPGFYDRIIRNDIELQNIRWYIRKNPERWGYDRENQL